MSDESASSIQVVLASANPGKVREIHALLAPLGLDVLPLTEFTPTQAEESGITFVENALIKARHAARHGKRPAIADDSGLEVDALDGAPGVRSARYAGATADDAANNARLLQALQGVPEEARVARFRCVLVFLRHEEDPSPLIAQGVWEGVIASKPEGSGGFGYDPLFFVPELGCTAAQLDRDAKNRVSHRGKAAQDLLKQLKVRVNIPR